MKRFTETDKWKDPWFRKLPGGVKIAFMFLLDNVDNAGVWDPDFELANFQIGMDVKWDKVKEALGDRISILPSGKWHLTRFIEFQYGSLNEDCKPHLQVIRLLDGHGIRRVSKGYPRGINTPKDKDKDKDKDKAGEIPGTTAEDVYAAYPNKVGRPKALKSIATAAKKLDASGPLDGHDNGMDYLLELTRAFARCVARWPDADRGYVPHPTTWFNQERYLDDPDTWTRHADADSRGQQPLPKLHLPPPEHAEPADADTFNATSLLDDADQ